MSASHGDRPRPIAAELVSDPSEQRERIQHFQEHRALQPTGLRVPDAPVPDQGEDRRFGLFRTRSTAQKQHDEQIKSIQRAGQVAVFTADVATVVEVQTLTTASSGVAWQEKLIQSLEPESLAREFASQGLIRSAHRQFDTLEAISERFRKKAIS